MKFRTGLSLALLCSGCFGAPTEGLDPAVVDARLAELVASGAVVQRWAPGTTPEVVVADPDHPAFGARLTASATTLPPGAPTLLAWIRTDDLPAIRAFSVTDVGPAIEAHVENPASPQDVMLADSAWLTLPVRNGTRAGRLDARQRADATVTLVLPGGIDTIQPVAHGADTLTAAIDTFGTFVPTLPDAAPQTIPQALALLETGCRIPLVDAARQTTAVGVAAVNAGTAAFWIDGLTGADADGLVDHRIHLTRSDNGAVGELELHDAQDVPLLRSSFSSDTAARPLAAQLYDADGAILALVSWQYSSTPTMAVRTIDFDQNGTAETTATTWFDAGDTVTQVAAGATTVTVTRTADGWPLRVRTSSGGATGCTSLSFSAEGTPAVAWAWTATSDCDAPSRNAVSTATSDCPREAFDLLWTETEGARAFGPGLLRPDRADPHLTR